eukprot:UN15247
MHSNDHSNTMYQVVLLRIPSNHPLHPEFPNIEYNHNISNLYDTANKVNSTKNVYIVEMDDENWLLELYHLMIYLRSYTHPLGTH